LHPGLHQLPKSYISISGQDTLRDDGRLLVEALQEGGVKVKYDEFPGYPHYFWTYPSKHLKATAEEFMTKAVSAIKLVVS
jgi:versiconal hemiacetal acetate esterase